jgi:hypothetical protein
MEQVLISYSFECPDQKRINLLINNKMKNEKKNISDLSSKGRRFFSCILVEY